MKQEARSKRLAFQMEDISLASYFLIPYFLTSSISHLNEGHISCFLLLTFLLLTPPNPVIEFLNFGIKILAFFQTNRIFARKMGKFTTSHKYIIINDLQKSNIKNQT